MYVFSGVFLNSKAPCWRQYFWERSQDIRTNLSNDFISRNSIEQTLCELTFYSSTVHKSKIKSYGDSSVPTEILAICRKGLVSINIVRIIQKHRSL